MDANSVSSARNVVQCIFSAFRIPIDSTMAIAETFPPAGIACFGWHMLLRFMSALARIFHSEIEQRSGESVRRLDITQPNENATHRFLYDRL